jgi:4-amino-4-deoxy-L-arabinose transferase-like glycosyltransferase
VNSPRSAVERQYFASHPASPVHAHARARGVVAPGRHRAAHPIPFGGPRGPLRIFGPGLGGQAGWLVPLALIGMLAVALALRRRTDRRAAGLLVLGGWCLVELGTLEISRGIVHPYYASALAPGLAAMAGAGAVGLASLVQSGDSRIALRGYVLAVVAIAATVAAQLVLINREGDPLWWRIPLVALCLCALIAIPLSRARAGVGLAVAIGALLVAPMVFSFSVWLAPVNGTFPAAGPYSYAGQGGLGVSVKTTASDRALISYLASHGATQPYPLLTQSSDQASGLILLGLDASAEGGYNTTDPALSGARLATLVGAGKARYFLIGGPYDQRGGNSAATAARWVCPEIPEIIWAANGFGNGSFLLDCKGQAARLRHPRSSALAFIRAHKVHYVL